jgi:hypothetical protein
VSALCLYRRFGLISSMSIGLQAGTSELRCCSMVADPRTPICCTTTKCKSGRDRELLRSITLSRETRIEQKDANMFSMLRDIFSRAAHPANLLTLSGIEFTMKGKLLSRHSRPVPESTSAAAVEWRRVSRKSAHKFTPMRKASALRRERNGYRLFKLRALRQISLARELVYC